jgi:hypothetical protein
MESRQIADARVPLLRSPVVSAVLVALFILMPARADEPATGVSAARPGGAGVLVHDVKSAFQAGTTQIRILLPDPLEQNKTYPVVYVLPVEAGNETRFGDGLLEVKKGDLPNRFKAIFAEPIFSQLPWYADHPVDRSVRQESYLLSVVLPFVEKSYPVRKGPDGRLLLGFSKSGWGAFSLLLRHPDLFGKAAAWDAPLMMGWPSRYGSAPIFGTKENFMQYQISTLLQKRAADLGKDPRLILMGYGNFRRETDDVHDLMDRLKIAHRFEAGPERKHEWGSGWVPEAVKLLLGGENKPAGP